MLLFLKRICIEGALLSQATKLGSNESLLNSRKKGSLESSGLESQFQGPTEPAYNSDQDENLQTSAAEQVDADDEEESEQVGKRIEFFFSLVEWMESILKVPVKLQGGMNILEVFATSSPYKYFSFYKYFVSFLLIQFLCILLHLCSCTFCFHLLLTSCMD